MNRSVVCSLLLVVFATVLTACQESIKAPAKAKVSGTVTLDGTPMAEGEVRFSVPGEPPAAITVKDGAFSGEASVGANVVEVVSEVDGPPHPMDPTQRIKVNKVAPQFSGPNSPLKQQIAAEGATNLKFDVTSAR
jgi:hypothetical protein